MLRHLKRRNQQELEVLGQSTNTVGHAGAGCNTLTETTNQTGMPLTSQQAIDMKRRHHQHQEEANTGRQQKRVRGRRSSKPAMEKRRRARINECLDILKSYVLNDSTNLTRLGIDLSGTENQLDEESIARQILKSSGLINRHRGRKNPNKLEKADILELTVDYVRRLHEQRDQLLSVSGSNSRTNQPSQMVAHQHQQQPLLMATTCHNSLSYGQQVVPAHLNEPLTLDLSPKSRLNGAQVNTSSTPPMLQAYRPPPNTPLTPPSSASSLQCSNDALELAPASSSLQHHHHQLTQMQLLSQVLDGSYKLNYPDWVSIARMNDQ